MSKKDSNQAKKTGLTSSETFIAGWVLTESILNFLSGSPRGALHLDFLLKTIDNDSSRSGKKQKKKREKERKQNVDISFRQKIKNARKTFPLTKKNFYLKYAKMSNGQSFSFKFKPDRFRVSFRNLKDFVPLWPKIGSKRKLCFSQAVVESYFTSLVHPVESLLSRYWTSSMHSVV